mgnify:CR=1 FL=1
MQAMKRQVSSSFERVQSILDCIEFEKITDPVDGDAFDEKGQRKHWAEGSREIASAVCQAMKAIDEFTTPNIEKAFNDLAVSRNCKLGELVGAVRLAVSGVTAGPGLWELFEVVGKEEVINRIEKALPLMQE